MFFDLVDRKIAHGFKKVGNFACFFSPWLLVKNGNLLFFILKQNRPKQSSLSRSRRKVTFFDYINVNLKSRNICFLYT